MTTTAPPTATRPPAVQQIDVDGLVREIEQYLAARTRTTAHPLVTKTTQELVAEALGTVPAEAAAAAELPGRMLRILPDWVLQFPIVRHRHGGGANITVAEHLELTALVIERYGWAQNTHRTTSGRRCILGAQAVLYRLGHGNESTVAAAGQRLQAVLAACGCTLTYAKWNDLPGRTQADVLALIREAARTAVTL
ncbi:DUF6197 family protein [Streptomyces sp. Wh19]|uniref:DUF6197 family protein n=1 Tax=Streptomyces sp. Wh19 TaxID=3076629 RepID=UPI0029589AFA|nr:hypothetical protein [Streptomyces sp. Wh19]MDV9195535.1 hypothetical protein [Streptomyces sp. Wh19]